MSRNWLNWAITTLPRAGLLGAAVCAWCGVAANSGQQDCGPAWGSAAYQTRRVESMFAPVGTAEAFRLRVPSDVPG